MLEALLATSIEQGDEETVLAALKAALSEGPEPTGGVRDEYLLRACLKGTRRVRDAVFEASTDVYLHRKIAEELIMGDTPLDEDEPAVLASVLSSAAAKRIVEHWLSVEGEVKGRSAGVILGVLMRSLYAPLTSRAWGILGEERMEEALRILSELVRVQTVADIKSDVVSVRAGTMEGVALGWLGAICADDRLDPAVAAGIVPVVTLALANVESSRLAKLVTEELGGNMTKWKLFADKLENQPKDTVAKALAEISETMAPAKNNNARSASF